MPSGAPFAFFARLYRRPRRRLAFHPVADVFPLMRGDAFASLCADVAANGLHEPIWLHRDGRIIDGRNRYRACMETGTVPTFRTFNGPDEALLPLALSLNLERRHLTSEQRAALAVDVERYEAVAAKERQRASGGDTTAADYAESVVVLIPQPGKARDKAAEKVGTVALDRGLADAVLFRKTVRSFQVLILIP